MLRPDLQIISEWIRPNSSVLDLGCGNGDLLEYLAHNLNVRGLGLEINETDIVTCIERGVDVIQLDLSKGLVDYFDRDMFDFVVMTQTLQALSKPVQLLQEMLRIGNEGIVAFPNMGYWRNRMQFLLRGRMPITEALPAAWYMTENIHLCTIKDFEDLCRDVKIHILERIVLDTTHKSRLGSRFLPNLSGEIVLYRLTQNNTM